MAASDWVSAALDQDGQPVVGEFDFGDGVRVKFNRGWVNLYDRKRATFDKVDGLEYPILSVNSGDLHYGGIYLRVARSTVQSGCMGVIYRTTYADGERTVRGVMGIGVNGFARDEDEDWETHKRDDGSTYEINRYVGIRPETVVEFSDLLSMAEERFAYSFGDTPEKTSLGLCPAGPFEDIPDEMRALDLSCLRQVNAGDLFFETHGVGQAPRMVIGDPEKPVMGRLIDIALR